MLEDYIYPILSTADRYDQAINELENADNPHPNLHALLGVRDETLFAIQKYTELPPNEQNIKNGLETIAGNNFRIFIISALDHYPEIAN